MENEVIAVMPTICEHPKRHMLLRQLVKEPLVKTVLLIDNGGNFVIKDYQEPYVDERIKQKVEHIHPGCNLNWLHSNNLGIQIALERGFPYVCLINDDVEICPYNKFFNLLLQSFHDHPKAGAVVPLYNGSFGDQAHCRKNGREWDVEQLDKKVRWVDGTCVTLRTEAVRAVGMLDPSFRAPGWGAEVDYCHRLTQAGWELYLTHRNMLWHYKCIGGRSAERVYGSRDNWIHMGCEQAKSDLEAKYGPSWRQIVPMPENAYVPEGAFDNT